MTTRQHDIDVVDFSCRCVASISLNLPANDNVMMPLVHLSTFKSAIMLLQPRPLPNVRYCYCWRRRFVFYHFAYIYLYFVWQINATMWLRHFSEIRSPVDSIEADIVQTVLYNMLNIILTRQNKYKWTYRCSLLIIAMRNKSHLLK